MALDTVLSARNLMVLWSTMLCSQRSLQKRLGDNGLFSQGSLTRIFIVEEETDFLYVVLYVQPN